MKYSSQLARKTDYSKISYSKIKIDQYQDRTFEQQIKKIKYPTYAISNAENLTSKIESFKDPAIKQKLTNQLKQLNCYRKVRGDGNCFFRALAFSYLSISPQPTVQQCFPYLNQINLTCCYPETIPKDFKLFYDQRFLIKMLTKYWVSYSKILKQCNYNSRKSLIKIFDLYPFLDFIIILYFRSLCLKSLWKLQQDFKQFLLGKQQEYIRKYSCQTQGVLINICSIMLNMIVHVYEIRKGIVNIYHYDNITKKQGEIHLLFYQNHYDLIQKNNKIDEEKDSLSINQYYGYVGTKMVMGQCIECYRTGRVYEQSSVCQFCFQKMERAAQKYDRKKKIRGICEDCGKFKDDVYQQLNICQYCIGIQNRLQKKRINDSQKENKNNEKQQNNKEKKDDSKDEQKNTYQSYNNRCIQCYSRNEVNTITGICQSCQNKQKIVLSKLETKKSQQTRKKSAKKEQQQNIRAKNRNNQVPLQREKVIGAEIKEKVIGTGIKQKTTDSRIKTTKKQLNSLNDQNENVKVGNCQNCNSLQLLSDPTPYCVKCYQKLFNQIDYCKSCKFKLLLHQDSLKCKKCHYQKSKQKNKVKLNQCSNCRRRQPFKLGYCQQCYKRYCAYCHRITGSTIINGACSICRSRV